jgi:type IV pilus assembly protein PilA
MKLAKSNLRQSYLFFPLLAATLTVAFVGGPSGCLAQTTSSDELSAAQMKEQNKYPLKDFGELFTRLQNEVQLPAPRNQSYLLPLLPRGTVFYAAFPNYGATAEQALQIVRQERESSLAFRDWWQGGDMAKIGPQIENAIEQFGNFSQYLGDEIVLFGSMNGTNPPSIALLAKIRKPGLQQAFDQMTQPFSKSDKPAIRVLDKQGLATAVESRSFEITTEVRPDYVIAASDLTTLRKLSRQLDDAAPAFASTPFAQRLQESYSGGLTIIAGLDLQSILRHAPVPPQQVELLRQTGFEAVQYAIWEHKEVARQPASEAELSFTGPRRGIASWLTAPRDLGGLDFTSPNAILVASVALKNPADIFEDVQNLATAANSNAFAQLDQMQQGLGLNLKDDLLSQLSGEITLEVDDIAQTGPAWRLMLQVNDVQRLQQTLGKLLATAAVSQAQSEEGGVTYHTLTVPSPRKGIEIGYAFADGYLILGSSGDAVREAVRLHREGGSLAKSSKFLAALPPGRATQASALYYSDPMKTLGLQLARFSPQLAQSLLLGPSGSKPAVICAYGEERAIREATTNRGVDAGMVLGIAAVALPNLLRARNSANESAAVGTLRNMVTAQVAYSAAYPARGYARDLARLGFDPQHPDTISPQHAGLLDPSLAKANCTTGTWCEKSGYKFTFAPACPKLICNEFVAIAAPVSPSAGGKNFCATSDGVIRMKPGLPLSAPISAAECRSWGPLR